MNLSVNPSPNIKGAIELPSSKSYSIRAHMIAACGGKSRIRNSSNCEDARAAKRIGEILGRARFPKKINVGESGTVLRFVLPLLCMKGKAIEVAGEGTLKGRPNHHLTRALRQMGAAIKGTGPKESIPIRIKEGTLSGGNVSINGSLSSQFISALLIACPQLKEPTHLRLTGNEIVSKDYMQMTMQILRLSGINVRQVGLRNFAIQGNQSFKGLGQFTVPSDFGLAAFHMALAILNDANVTLKGHLTNKFIQADGHIFPLLKKMGAQFKMDSKRISIKGMNAIRGGRFSLKNCPDLVPIMAVLALFAKGRTTLADIAHVRSKESDRISDLRKELAKIGAMTKESRDSLTIIPQDRYKANCLLNPHQDHRLAMAFSVLGSKIGVHVKDIECTRKSYPDFVKDFRVLGALAKKN